MEASERTGKKFSTVYRGLDEKEVRDHLRKIQAEIDERDKRIAQLEEMLDEREENISSFRSVETSINEAILTAQRAGDDMKEAARERANEIIAAAESERERIMDEAMSRARHIGSQTEDMKRQSKVFRARFKMLVQAQLDLLESDDWDYLLDYDLDNEDRARDIVGDEENNDG
ncbi:DivIVA domain-containing protein [Salinicoccus halitifaciens]|uniref:Cell division initiation protein n=1 Tax=Salinicoccus halitifaciens TaxID=1073415 RepID=A0ABV2E7F3_9STAP|nr:DivIVA domain-containing protein [Salinicoccus halitifaciens]MCD2136587.1 DivIVA domain-containing protein [Salinicoccus halitifaciens]